MIRRKKRLLAQGIWDENGITHANWHDPDSGYMAFFLDILTLDGLLTRAGAGDEYKTSKKLKSKWNTCT